MCSPCQSDKDRLEKIQNDVECMLLLQEATNPHGVNCKLLCIHNDEDFEVEVLEEVEPQRQRCSDSGHHRTGLYGMPPEGVLIKLAYTPKPKTNCRSVGPCLKHSKSVSPCRDGSGVDNSSRHKVIRASRLDNDEKEKRSQQLKCIRNRLKELEEALKAERDNKMAVMNEVEVLRCERERLQKENCKLKNEAECLNAAQAGSCELMRELSSLKEERCELKSLVDDQKNIINSLEKKFCKLKSESKKMHQEGENKIQELLQENLDLSNKIQCLNNTLTCMKKEIQSKGKKCCSESSAEQSFNVREGKEELNKQGNLENELQCLRSQLSEKENLLQGAKEQIDILKCQMRKAKEELERSVSSNTELENLYNEVKENLEKSETALRCTQRELCRVKKEQEIKEGEFKSTLEEKEREIAGLNDTNQCLKEKLCSQSALIKKQKLQDDTCNEESHSLSCNVGRSQGCLRGNECKSYANASQQTMNCGSGSEARKLCALQEELEETRNILEEERKEAERKCKLIKELQGNIKHIKENESCKLKELQNALREKEQSERSMKMSVCQERRQNEKLLDELTELKWQEKELSRQLDETHAQLAQYECSMSSGNECMEHTRLLEQIEQEVEMKTVQWQDYARRLTKERDDAIRAAKFASRKLMSSVADFQSHVARQRKVQEMLFDLLYQKDVELKNATFQISKRKSEALNKVYDVLVMRKKY